MDHLLLPDGASHYIIVPYVATEPYDGGDFLTYPQRRGWSTDIEDMHFGGHSPEEVNAFLQEWLFFGCLSEIMKAARVEIREDDFIDHEHNTVTTKSLPGLVMRWQELWPRPKVSRGCDCVAYQYYNPGRSCSKKRCWTKVIGRRNAPAIRVTTAILDRVSNFVTSICGKDRSPESASGETLGRLRSRQRMAAKVVDPAIAMSISSLGNLLERTSLEIYEMPLVTERRDWWGTFYIHERLQNANWCPSRILQLLDSYEIDMRYYCAALPLRQDGDHSKCDDIICLAVTVDFKTYQQKHVPGCSCGPDSDSAPPMDDIISIIQSNGIPVVTWAEGQGDHPSSYGTVLNALSIGFGKHGPNPLPAPGTPSGAKQYVAISHVPRMDRLTSLGCPDSC